MFQSGAESSPSPNRLPRRSTRASRGGGIPNDILKSPSRRVIRKVEEHSSSPLKAEEEGNVDQPAARRPRRSSRRTSLVQAAGTTDGTLRTPSRRVIRKVEEHSPSPLQEELGEEVDQVAVRRPIRSSRRKTLAPQDAGTADSTLKTASRPMIHKVEEHSPSPPQEELEEEEEEVGEAIQSCDDEGVLSNEMKFHAEMSKALANGGPRHAVGHRDILESQGFLSWSRLILGAITLATITVAASYKAQSASIGYCYPGTNTNAILGERHSARIAAQECTKRLTDQSGESQQASNVTCTPLPLLPLPEPMSCTPCPTHAYCTPDTVTCDPSFVLRQHSLAVVPFLPQLLNGMPGLGPVALPPSCVEDEERKRNTGRLGVALENYLALTRGHRLCVGVTEPNTEGGEAVQLGLQLERVHDHLKKITVIQVCRLSTCLC